MFLDMVLKQKSLTWFDIHQVLIIYIVIILTMYHHHVIGNATSTEPILVPSLAIAEAIDEMTRFNLGDSEAAAAMSEGNGTVGDTGGEPCSMDGLKKQMDALTAKMAGLQLALSKSNKEKESMAIALKDSNTKLSKLESHNQQLQTAAKENPRPSGESSEPVSKEAARGRLRRLCTRKTDGSLNVSEDIHQQYQSGGTARDKLLRIFIETGMDKVRALKVQYWHFPKWCL